MNVQIKISDLVYMLDANMVIDQVAKAVKDPAEKSGLVMPAPEVGSGYMVWRLPGDCWVSFYDLNDDAKATNAAMILERIDRLKSIIGRPDLAAKITHIPDAKYAYFRDRDGKRECALVGWAYRYPESRAGNELETWINRVKKQDVSLGFSWGDDLMPDQPFTIQNVSHSTTSDGTFHVGSVPVGSNYAILHKPTQRTFSLDVEPGKDKYIYDLTQSFKVTVSVKNDGNPVANADVKVVFDGATHILTTDNTGTATMDMPMKSDGMGSPLPEQPACVASYLDNAITKIPDAAECTLHYEFYLKPDVEIPPVEPPKFVTIELHDVVGTPVADMPIFLTTKKKKKMALHTDADGKVVVPKEWFTPGEKMQITFDMTPEYRETHGMELDLKKRKKTK